MEGNEDPIKEIIAHNSRRSKMIVLISVFVVAVLAVAGYFVYKHGFFKNDLDNGNNINQETDRDLKKTMEQETETGERIMDASSSTDISKCEGLRQQDAETCRKSVASNIALEENNESVCDMYPDAEECKDLYKTKSAVASGDANMCKEITNSNRRDECYYNLAVSSEDRSYCENIANDALRSIC